MPSNGDQVIHETYMRRCIDLARQAEGLTYPNPLVGAVIVHQNKIIGEGYHQRAGEQHAEIHAIESTKNHGLLKESTLYVNLEPCAHFGKTPPCALQIQQKKIPRVIVGCTDTFSKVAGRGISMLKSSGIEVITGVLEKDCRELNRRFFTFHEKERPYIILKWAETLDGFIDVNRGGSAENRPTWITNEHSIRVVHAWRSREQSILVGAVTARKDNPSLTVRDWSGKHPLRIVLNRGGDIPGNLAIFNGEAPTIIFTENEERVFDNAEKVIIPRGVNPVTEILGTLYNRGVQSLIVEGGAMLLNSFIKANLWDEARVFQGSRWFKTGVKAPRTGSEPVKFENLGSSNLFIYRNI